MLVKDAMNCRLYNNQSFVETRFIASWIYRVLKYQSVEDSGLMTTQVKFGTLNSESL
ncbi:MAG: hypothetical protein V7K61_10110 [Nostoc sp.]